jgi:hypothetical protein
MKVFTMRKRSSNLALAIALATGSAVVATAAFPSEAHAQRKKKDKKEEDSDGGYSKEFVAAFQPLNEAVQTEGVDLAGYKPQIMALASLANSADEKSATGGLMFNTGIKLENREMQLQGMELMLESGKAAPDQVGRYNFIAYQLANALKQHEKARTYLQNAINLNFTTPQVSAADLQIAMAENFFAADKHAEGLDYLHRAIKAEKARGGTVEEQWYRRGLTIAYNNQVVPQVYDYVTMWIGDYPSTTNWRDAVNLTRNLNNFDPQQTLDLLRLARTVKSLDNKQDYILYVETADARRLPKEVKELIEEAYAAEAVSRDDIYVADALATATGRVSTDRADLPALEKDANRPNAPLRTVTAAAGAFLSYGDNAKAVKFYQKALTLPGVDRGEALTRLGMAQIGLGDYTSALETLAKVDGPRGPIAKLWLAYAAEQNSSVNSAASPTE